MHRTIEEAANAYARMRLRSLLAPANVGVQTAEFEGAMAGGAAFALGLSDEESAIVDSRLAERITARVANELVTFQTREVFKGLGAF